MTRTTIFAAMCGLTALLISGCSSDPGATTADDERIPSVAQTSSPGLASDDATPSPSGDTAEADVESYMDAVQSYDVDRLREVSEAAAEDSPAAVYAAHQANVLEAELDGGSAPEPGEMTKAGDEYELCASDGSSCISYGDFEQNDDGELVTFTIDGESIAPLLSQGDGSAVQAGGADFTFLTSYRSVQSNAVFVVVKVQSGSRKLDLNVYTAKYRDPSGKQREAGTGGGPTELDADSNAYVYSAFVGVEPGGVMTLDGCVAGCDETYSIKIRTK